MCNRILVLIQPVFYKTQILDDLALYFSILTIPMDNGQLGFLAYLVVAFF